MPTVQVRISGGEALVEYGTTGTGSGVLLVHGTGGNRTQWGPLIAELEGRFTVVAPDYSGSGGTTDHGGPMTLDDLTDEVLAVADHAGLDRFHIVGHSLGSVIAARIAAGQPHRVRSLVMQAGWAYTDTRMTADFQYSLELLRTDLRHGTSLFPTMLPLATLGPRYWAATSAEAHEELVSQLPGLIAPGTARQFAVDLEVDLRPILDRITAPTLVIVSSDDRIVSVDQQRALRDGIRDAQCLEIKTGHNALTEDPRRLVTMIASFLDGQQGRDGLAGVGAATHTTS